jgi:hypothetical protein
MSILYEKEVWDSQDTQSLKNIEGFNIIGNNDENPINGVPIDGIADNINPINKPVIDTPVPVIDTPVQETTNKPHNAREFLKNTILLMIGFMIAIISVVYIIYTTVEAELYRMDDKPPPDIQKILDKGFKAVIKENAESTFKTVMDLAYYLSSKIGTSLRKQTSKLGALFSFLLVGIIGLLVTNRQILGLGYVTTTFAVIAFYSMVASFMFIFGWLKYILPIIQLTFKNMINYITDPRNLKVVIIGIIILILFGAILLGLVTALPNLFKYFFMFLGGILLLSVLATTFSTICYMFFFIYTTLVNKDYIRLVKTIVKKNFKLIFIGFMIAMGMNMYLNLDSYKIPTGIVKLNIGHFLGSSFITMGGLIALLGLTDYIIKQFKHDDSSDDSSDDLDILRIFKKPYVKPEPEGIEMKGGANDPEKSLVERYYSIMSIISIVVGYAVGGEW